MGENSTRSKRCYKQTRLGYEKGKDMKKVTISTVIITCPLYINRQIPRLHFHFKQIP
jgi:hypothetical protein